MAKWIEKAVGMMHTNKITNKDIAAKLGVTPEYISMILNEKKTPKNAQQDVLSAIEAIRAERK